MMKPRLIAVIAVGIVAIGIISVLGINNSSDSVSANDNVSANDSVSIDDDLDNDIAHDPDEIFVDENGVQYRIDENGIKRFILIANDTPAVSGD